LQRFKNTGYKPMKDKIISKAGELFLKLGFKSITMDDIAAEMGISKKTIYKYFSNKEILIEESTSMMHTAIHQIIESIIAENHNPIKESFEIKRMFQEMFKVANSSPLYQLKKHYPEIYDKVVAKETSECNRFLRHNIERGINDGWYRKHLNIEAYIKFYYTLIFSIKDGTSLESESQKLELEALEYHTRAMATEKGIKELELQLSKTNL
jgi:AcrR family transcriptional regulator